LLLFLNALQCQAMKTKKNHKEHYYIGEDYFPNLKKKIRKLPTFEERIKNLHDEHFSNFYDLVLKIRGKHNGEKIYCLQDGFYLFFESKKTLETFGFIDKDERPKKKVETFILNNVKGDGFQMQIDWPQKKT